jgi:hypothetical protein
MGFGVFHVIENAVVPDTKSSPSESNSKSSFVGTGETGRIVSNTSVTVLVGTTADNYDRFIQLAAARDNNGWAAMILNGQLMPINSGTQCRVIDGGIMKDEVRILSGSFSGQSGFVAPEFVKP